MKKMNLNHCKKLMILLLFTFFLAACSKGDSITSPEDSQAPQDNIGSNSTCQLILIESKDGNLLGAEVNTYDLYILSTKDATIQDSKGTTIDASSLAIGSILEVTYDGNILEIYPSMFSQVYNIKVVETKPCLLLLYQEIIEDILSQDTGLDADTSVIALDLTKATNMTDSQKNALTYLISSITSKECYLSTYDDLVAQGLIDSDSLSFETGVLITIEVSDEKPDSFSFSLTKWRSGDGAIGYSSSTAKLVKDKWTYKLDGAWIS